MIERKVWIRRRTGKREQVTLYTAETPEELAELERRTRAGEIGPLGPTAKERMAATVKPQSTTAPAPTRAEANRASTVEDKRPSPKPPAKPLSGGSSRG